MLAVSFLLSGPWGQTFRGDMQVQLPGLLSGDPGEVWEGDVWVIIVACRRPVGGGDSAPPGITLGRWLRSCLPWIALAVSCIIVGAPPLSCLGLADSRVLSEGDSSAVLKSDESDWASWM